MKILLKEFCRKKRILIFVFLFLAILLFIFCYSAKATESDKSAFAFEYTTKVENDLAEEVVEYTKQYIVLEDNDFQKIGDAAVKGYRTVLNSGVKNITSEHSAALVAAMSTTLHTYILDDSFSEEQMERLSGGICQIIWNTLLTQLKESDISIQRSYDKEMKSLCGSLQEQIDELASKTTAVTISANIQKNDAEFYESFEESINHQLSEVENKVNYLEEKIEGISGTSGTNGQNGVNGRSGSSGKSGTDGKDGQNGVDGTDGKDGRDGTNGRTTYIAYADDPSGNGFSLVPTASTKYIGTCITTASSQPTDASKYSRWQEYRAYVITSTTDENGVTTLHIN